MNSLFISGATGFVGRNFIEFISDEFNVVKYTKKSPILINQSIVIHLAGKAHDLKQTTNPDEYYDVNTELTKQVFDAFLFSDAKLFITLSSTKAVADEVVEILFEDNTPNPITHYGKSKLLAEEYILSKEIPKGKRVYILRPSMIHGPGNKGNLTLLYKLVKLGIPWPLGSYENKRSFCSIDNLNFIIKELITQEDIPSGVYNVADDDPVSTNELITLIAKSNNLKPRIWKINKKIIQILSKFGDIFSLPLNSERLYKLTNSYIVSNDKIKKAIGKELPISTREGLIKTFHSLNK